MTYKNILFDMGNVIIDFAPDYILMQYTKDVRLINSLKHAIFLNPVWAMSDQDLASEDDIYRSAIEMVDPAHHSLVKEIVQTWYVHKTENQKMFEIIKALKAKGYHIYLCSNAAKSFYHYEKDIASFRHLDGKVISADIKLVKPSADYFNYVLNKYKLKAEECFFIDDLVANIKGAYQCGIDGYWYNGNTDLLQAFLQEVGIL